VWAIPSRKTWQCSAKGCGKQFSVTSGTIFASRKRPIRDYLLAIAIFVNGVKGHSALQLSRDLDCQYKTAFVLAHKLREAMGSEVHNPDQRELSGTVEIDGMYAGGNIKPENRKADRKDRRLAEEQTGKRQVVVVAREVMGRTLPFILPRESEAVPLIREHVASGTIIHALPPMSPCPSVIMSIKALRSSVRDIARRRSGLSKGGLSRLIIKVRLTLVGATLQIARGAMRSFSLASPLRRSHVHLTS
jgi:hypothetical protein